MQTPNHHAIAMRTKAGRYFYISDTFLFGDTPRKFRMTSISACGSMH